MAKRDLSPKLGGMAGKAAGALRGRAAALEAGIEGTPAKRKMINAVKGKIMKAAAKPKKRSGY